MKIVRPVGEDKLLKVTVNGVTYLVSPKVKNRKELTPNVTHGLIGTYISYGCRCDDCTKTNNHHQAKTNADRIARLKEDPTLAEHGKRSTYVNWGCRCPACTAAHSAACSEYQIRTGRTKRRRKAS